MAGLDAGRSLRLAPPQRAEAFDFGTCKTPRNADGIARWCLKALPRNSDGTITKSNFSSDDTKIRGL